MVQIYFLSIVLNFTVGFVLVYGLNLVSNSASKELSYTSKVRSTKKSENDVSEKDESKKKSVFKNCQLMDNKTFRLVLGILTFFVGIMKFLTVFKNDVPVIGDLIPALCGLAGGASVLVEYYLTSAESETELPLWVMKTFVESRKYIGIACLASGILHFIFPQVVLL